MNAQELKSLLQGKRFQSTDLGITYKFIPENTLQVGGHIADSVHYNISEEGEKLYLDHSSRFGTEPMLIEIVSSKYPVTLAFSERYSKKFFGTWKQVDY